MSSLARAYREARWGWIALVWAAVFAFDAARTILGAAIDHRPLGQSWTLVDAMSMSMWALYTPFMLWMVERAPLERHGWPRAALAHAAAYLALTLVDSIAQTSLFGALLATRPPIASLFTATLLVDGFSYATVIAIGHAQRARRQQAALDRELTRARLRALEMQLQPHFLFNTLHAVGALVRGDRGDDAVRCLATLGDLLRATLADDGGSHDIALAEEAQLARAYLDLQQIRFGDRLRVALDVAPSLGGARVPRLILQPLLENAIRHGVERSTAAIELEVRAQAIGPRLELLVRDRGGARGAPTPGQGIGLANTRARLDALYGRDHRLELAPTDGGGLAVTIDLPLAMGGAS
jgi:hypothetical protein